MTASPDLILLAIVLITGFILGFIPTLLLTRSRTEAARQAGRQELATELATLAERLASKEVQLERQFQELAQKEESLGEIRQEVSNLRSNRAELQTRLEEERKLNQEKLNLLNEAQISLANAFKALSAEALQSNNQSFLHLAKATLEKFQESAQGDLDQRQKAIDHLVKPLQESLTKVDSKIGELEKARSEAYTRLDEQIKSLLTTQSKLESETTNLVKALRAPTVRGRWGEIQLRRVVEMAGMVNYCDFLEQESVSTESGRLRPDLIVKLPNAKNIVVDAKAPLMAYLEALEESDDSKRSAHLADHARQIRDHLQKLSAKNYWDQFEPTPEFVVLFLPGETFFSAALEQDPGLIEYGVDKKVLLATPTTLIALLRAVAYGWRQEQLAENAQVISQLGKELYDRLVTLTSHFAAVGKGLDKAVDGYNRAVASLDSRVLVTARKFKELGTYSGKELETPVAVEKAARGIEAPGQDN